MDKETVRKIDEFFEGLRGGLTILSLNDSEELCEDFKNFVESELGYRKQPSSPPVLSDEEIQHELRSSGYFNEYTGLSKEEAIIFKSVAQAQRDAAVEYYEKKGYL